MADPTDDTPEETPKVDRSIDGKKFVKRLKQIDRELSPDNLCAVLQKNNKFTFAGSMDLLMQYAMDMLVRRASQMKIDPLQIVFDLLIQYGYADQSGGLILPGDINDKVKKPHHSGDGAPNIIIPPGVKLQ